MINRSHASLADSPLKSVFAFDRPLNGYGENQIAAVIGTMCDRAVVAGSARGAFLQHVDGPSVQVRQDFMLDLLLFLHAFLKPDILIQDANLRRDCLEET